MDARPKVRRKAQDAVLAIAFSDPTHPYAERSATWVISTLETGAKEVRQGGLKGNAEELTSRLIGLAAFVKEAADKWPKSVSVLLYSSFPTDEFEHVTVCSRPHQYPAHFTSTVKPIPYQINIRYP